MRRKHANSTPRFASNSEERGATQKVDAHMCTPWDVTTSQYDASQTVANIVVEYFEEDSNMKLHKFRRHLHQQSGNRMTHEQALIARRETIETLRGRTKRR